MPRIDLDILNQKQTPAFYASSLATRPAASFVGRIFIDSDNPSTGLYRDTGTAWVQIADPGAGTTGTLQQVTTNGSSTTIGISTSGNGIGIGTTIPGSNRLDIHSSSGINATFNGTGTTNAALQLQLAGVGKWNLSNFYNAAANDFIITDVLNTTNRLTIKNTGQTFIGTDTTSSGLFVVNSSTSDNHYVAIGSNAPSYRLRDVGSGGALNCGIGISTATNNFIQGSANGNFCFFNSSSTASPILFGIYDAGTGNTQEAVRISAARNLLVGTSTDSGYKLDINGTGRFSGDLSIAYTTANLRFFLNNTTATTGRSWYFNSYSNGNLYVGNTTAGDIFNFSSTGVATFTGALSGTSATLSNSLTVTNQIIANLTVGKLAESGTILTGVTKSINLNGLGGNLSAGLIVCSSAGSSSTFNSVIIVSGIHTQGANIFSLISSSNDSVNAVISLVGNIIQIVNNSGVTLTYNCRYINFCDLNSWSGGY